MPEPIPFSRCVFDQTKIITTIQGDLLTSEKITPLEIEAMCAALRDAVEAWKILQERLDLEEEKRRSREIQNPTMEYMD